MRGDRLVSYPYVVVRVSCANCQRAGRWQLARLAEKYGAEISLDALLARLVADCGTENPRHPIHREYQARFGIRNRCMVMLDVEVEDGNTEQGVRRAIEGVASQAQSGWFGLTGDPNVTVRSVKVAERP